MNLKPWNRRLLVEMIETDDEQTSSILVPEDYKPKHECDYHVPARVLACASDATQSLTGKRVILQSNGIEEFKVNDEMHYLVLENYVVCVLEE
jgi:co-chaperonin GroES (HSP10)